MRVRVFAAAVLAALVLAPAARAQDAPSEVLKSDPYYLSFFEAEGQQLGTVLLLHGGGWRGDKGPAADDEMRQYIDRLTGWGYDVANLGYRTGLPGLADAVDAFDLIRQRTGPRERVCLFGGSAGAQLALFVAAERGASVDCVVDFLGPPDLTAWGSQPGADLGRNLAVEAFGAQRLAALSPINMVDRITAPVLVGAAPCDIFIELSDQERFVEALNAAGGTAYLQVIESGDEVPLGHCAVERASFGDFLEVARPFLAGDPDPLAADDDTTTSGLVILVIAAALVAAGALGYWVFSRMKSSTA
jgi:acetyl esterase/lipase